MKVCIEKMFIWHHSARLQSRKKGLFLPNHENKNLGSICKIAKKEAEELKFEDYTHVRCEYVNESKARKTLICTFGCIVVGCICVEANVVEDLRERYKAEMKKSHDPKSMDGG